MRILKDMLLIVETIIFIWFFLPLLLKGILNTGNAIGMLAMAIAFFMTLKNDTVEIFIGRFTDSWIGKGTVVAVSTLLIGILVLMFTMAMRIALAGYKTAPKANMTAVVLGCGVKGDKPSRILSERVNAAYIYLQQNPKALCILSGGKGEGEDISEAECMYRELTDLGIDKERLIKEDNSTSTEENITYTSALLEEYGLEKSVVLITSEFHEYRAGQLANQYGLQTYAYGASTDLLYFPTYFLREVLGISYMWIVQKINI